MKLDIRKIPNNASYIQEEEVTFKDIFNTNDFFNKCNSCKVKITATSYSQDMIRVDYEILANLNILNKENGNNFNKDFKIFDTLYYTDNEELANSDNVDEIIILNKSMIIDLDEDIYSLIVCNLPLDIQ